MTAAASTTTALQSLLDGLVRRKQIAHAVIAVESGDRSLRWIGAAGDDGHGTPMRLDTPYHVASVTKLYTAAIVLRLHERGKLDVDEPMTTYLPESVTHRLNRLDGVDRTGSITVRQLIDNTSGLASYFEDRPKGGISLAEAIFREGDRAVSTTDVAEIVRNQLKPQFPPGRKVFGHQLSAAGLDRRLGLLLAERNLGDDGRVPADCRLM